MSRTRTAFAGLAAAASALAVGFAALTPALASAQADPVVELCAATGVDQVDALLAELDGDQLAALGPLLGLTVPNSDGVFVLRADVTTNDVREALECPAVVDPTPDPTTEPTPTTDPTPEPTSGPTTTPAPTTTAPATTVDPIADDDSVADTSGDQVVTVPEGSVDTGSA